MVCVIVFAASIALALAEKLRCAWINATSSSVMSTFACSSAPDWIRPVPLVFGSLICASPEMPVELHLESPSWRRPSGF